MSKIQLPKKFELRGDHYTIAYFPGDETQIEPNFASMTPLQADCTQVKIPGTQGKHQDKWMTWCVAEIRAKVGTNSPAKRFLLFRLFDRPVDPALCPMVTMIVYAIQPTQQAMSLEQAFINSILGVEEPKAAPVEQDDWAMRLFSTPEKEVEEDELDEGTELRAMGVE